MPIDRTFILLLALSALLSVGLGCPERATTLPVIESVGPPPPRALSSTIRIATANLWGVSVLGFDWADDIDERFSAMAKRLGTNKAMLDIVLIQEAWKDAARRALLNDEGVERNFPYRVDVVDQPGGAGLVILSRFPIEKAHFQRFQAQGRCFKFWEGDCISGKGILAVRVSLGSRSIWIGDTHLIACYSDAGEPETACDSQDPNGQDRGRQIIEARQTIEQLVGRAPIILGGDFNITRTSRYYPWMTSAVIPSDASDPSASHPRSPEPGATETARGWTEPNEEAVVRNRLDYLWTRPGMEIRWHPQESVRAIFTEPVVLDSGESVALSDHPILATEICLVRIDDPENRCLPL
jgi:hypothetical protein